MKNILLEWLKYFLIYIGLFAGTYGIVTSATFAYKTVSQVFETRGAISKVDFEGYTCFVGKGNMECFKDN